VSGFGPLVGGLVYEARADSLGAQSVSYNGQNNPSDDLTSAPPAAFSASGQVVTRVLPPLSVSLFHLEGRKAITLVANPTVRPVGGSAILTATVSDPFGAPVADGTTVTFSTSLGHISPFTATTVSGVATATLSSTVAGVAAVTATVGSLSATALVTFTPGAPFTLTLTAIPATLLVGNSSALTATVTDQFGNPVADGTTISFAASLGTLSSSTANTSAGGAVVALASLAPGPAVVTATVGSLSSNAVVMFGNPCFIPIVRR